MCRLYRKHCALTNKAMGTNWQIIKLFWKKTTNTYNIRLTVLIYSMKFFFWLSNLLIAIDFFFQILPWVWANYFCRTQTPFILIRNTCMTVITQKQSKALKGSPCITPPNKIFSNVILLCLTRIRWEKIVQGSNSCEQIFCLLIIREDNACIKTASVHHFDSEYWL